ncbi:MAG: DNA alkylation repair protein [Candidatus Bathyarchaeia archaeon]
MKSLSSPEAVVGMSKFGINPKNTYGISIPKLREIAKDIGKNHQLALELWKSDIHEARILASFIDEPEKVTENQLEKWVRDFDSWDVCDQVCNLFEKTPYAYQKAIEWTNRKEEFIKRAAFALMAGLAVHDKKASNEQFEHFFPLIREAATDDRNFVKKAGNWALRNIGKRNKALNERAMEIAREIQEINSKTAKWIASDALRELSSHAIQKRLKQ